MSVKQTHLINRQKLPIPNPHDWLTVTQAAELAGCARSTLYLLAKDGTVPSYTIGSARVFWRAHIEELTVARATLGLPTGSTVLR